MASLNKVSLIGNLGRDPETRTFQNGGKVCSFSIACSESWRSKDTGEKKERTEWINIDVQSDGLVKVCEQYLRKGSKVYVEGQLRTRKWQDQSGNDRYSTSVVLGGYGGTLIMLDGPQCGNRNDGDYGRKDTQGGYGSGGSPASDMDDSIPFAPEWR